jgi:hypoxanthine phosphoribosyltransferase
MSGVPERRPRRRLSWFAVVSETWDFQAYRGSSTPRFANPAERDCARLLDHYGIPWEYEPRTFVLAEAPDGSTREAFTPDFFLPEQGLYLEVTVTRPGLAARKRRKVRLLRERHPEIRVKLFERRDLEALARRHGLDLAS